MDPASRRGLPGAVALAAGGSLALAFAPFHAFWVAPLALGAFFRLCEPLPWPRAALRGWLFGLGMFGAGVSWVVESFQYNQVAFPVALALTGLLVAGLALFPAALAAAVTALPAGSAGARMLLVWPAAWTLFEWLRGTLFTGFTWLQAGYAQIDTPLAGWLPVGGVYAVSWATALTGGALAYALARPRRTGLILGVVASATLWLAGWRLAGVSWTTPSGAPLRVAMVQGNVPQALKWRPEQRAPTMRRYEQLTGEHADARLVIWPETAVPGFYREMRPYLARLDVDARARGAALLVGLPTVDAAGRRPLNSVAVLGARDAAEGDGGGLADFYHKRHLVPFGEYLPLAGWLGPVVERLGIPVSNFAPGPDNQPLPSVAGDRLGVSICYEIAFARDVNRALPAASVLVNVSNDAWFGRSIGPHQHLQMARVRARETGRPVARATNTGITAFIGPGGEVRARAPQFETTVLAADVVPRAGATPYVAVFGRFGHVLHVAVLVGLIVIGLAVGLAIGPAGGRRPGWGR